MSEFKKGLVKNKLW